MRFEQTQRLCANRQLRSSRPIKNASGAQASSKLLDHLAPVRSLLRWFIGKMADPRCSERHVRVMRFDAPTDTTRFRVDCLIANDTRMRHLLRFLVLRWLQIRSPAFARPLPHVRLGRATASTATVREPMRSPSSSPENPRRAPASSNRSRRCTAARPHRLPTS